MVEIHAHKREVVADNDDSGAWRVEWFGSDGECYLTIFAGPGAEHRARAYGEWLGQMIVPDPDYGDHPEMRRPDAEAK